DLIVGRRYIDILETSIGRFAAPLRDFTGDPAEDTNVRNVGQHAQQGSSALSVVGE
nr:hypothetical protein [Tanacetum cinerariifolium]